jgi:hypothetical protein
MATEPHLGDDGYLAHLAHVAEMNKQSINAEADKIINGQRREDYGAADESFRKIAVGWSVILGVTVNPMQVIQAMVWLKVCRSLKGYQRDSYVDICGYAGLAEVLHDAEEERKQPTAPPKLIPEGFNPFIDHEPVRHPPDT